MGRVALFMETMIDKLSLQDRTPTSKKNDHHEVVKLKI